MEQREKSKQCVTYNATSLQGSSLECCFGYNAHM